MKITPLEQYREIIVKTIFMIMQMMHASRCSRGWFNLKGYTVNPKKYFGH